MDLTRVAIKFLDNAQTPGGVAGILALLIAGTLCIVYFEHPADNPEIQKVLIYALTTIIGFYFGTTTTKASHASDQHNKNRSNSN